VPDRGYERRRDDRGTRGALGSKEFLGITLENPVISNLGRYSVFLLGIYTKGYRAGPCAQTRLGIRMYQSVRT